MRTTHALAILILVAGCQKKEEAAEAPVGAAAQPAAAPAPAQPTANAAAAPAAVGTTAKADIKALGNSGVSGTITFTTTPDGSVQVSGALHGLTPGEHGFHVHETGNCESADGMSAGGHFNPTSHPHGDVAASDSHSGDLGNVVADAKGDATVNVTKKGASIATGATSYVGKAVIVHKKHDDLKSQPAGDAGERIACGVITAG